MTSHRRPSALVPIPPEVIAKLADGVTTGFVADRTKMNRAQVRQAMLDLGARYLSGRWRIKKSAVKP